MPRLYSFVRLVAALVVTVPLAAQQYSLQFRETTIVAQEGSFGHVALDLVGEPLKGVSFPVHYSYSVPTGSGSGEAWMYDGGRSVGWSIFIPEDDVYTKGMTGRLTATYTHPLTHEAVELGADISVKDDEFQPYPYFDDVRTYESDAGNVQTMRVWLPYRSAFPTEVDVRTCCGTATAGSDFELIDETYTFAPMQVEGEVRFRILADSASEGPETFDIYGLISDRRGTVTIVEEDLYAIVSSDSLRVMAGDPFTIETWLPEAAPGPFGTLMEIGDQSIVRFDGTRSFQLGTTPKQLLFRAMSAGVTTITITPGSTLYSTTVVPVEVYDVDFDIGPVEQPLQPGDEIVTPVTMHPAGTGIDLSIDVAPAGVIETSPHIPIDASGRGELMIRAMRPGTAAVHITTPYGRTVSYFDVRVEASLGITGVAPNSGPAAGGTSVIISGAAFRGTCSVKFGESTAASVTRLDETTLRATTPAYRSGTVDVAVTCDGATAKRAAAFTFIAGRGRAVRH